MTLITSHMTFVLNIRWAPYYSYLESVGGGGWGCLCRADEIDIPCPWCMISSYVDPPVLYAILLWANISKSSWSDVVSSSCLFVSVVIPKYTRDN